MYHATTNNIKVSVIPHFLEEQSDVESHHYVWAYHITIINLSDKTVQLKRRYWHIQDANGKVQEVRGDGVVGEQPILEPNEQFSYASGCPLTTASGIMKGHFEMIDSNSTAFNIAVPTFSLDSQWAKRVLN
jgi:ApaG protein